MSKYQKFNVLKINRSVIQEAYYNPRKITDENREKLRKNIKKSGLVQPLIWNETTGHLVSGHQRLSILDELEDSQDYDLDVAVIKVDQKQEVKLNIFLNNQSAMGEWDNEMLQDIKETFPDISFINDLGFDKVDLDFLDLDFAIDEEKPKTVEEKFLEDTDGSYAKRVDQFEEYKKNYDDFKKETIDRETREGGSISNGERNDYCLTVVFKTNEEKWAFMDSLGAKNTEKYLKAEYLYPTLDFLQYNTNRFIIDYYKEREK